MGLPALSLDTLAVGLANEGVPLRAIARVVKLPSGTVRKHLTDAHAGGRLLELPRDEWPPGFPRDQRSLQLSRLMVENKSALTLAVQQVFGLTPTEAEILLGLIQNRALPKDNRSDMTGKTVDVHICYIRKALLPSSVVIATLWGYGYQLAPDDRRKILDKILAHLALEPL